MIYNIYSKLNIHKIVCLFHVAVEPANEVRGLSVDSGESWLSASVPPRNNSGQLGSAHEGSTGISLARVLATGIKTSADHGVSDVILSISTTAVIITDHRDSDLHQDLAKAAALGGGSPSRHGAVSSCWVLLSVRWQADGPDVRAAEVSHAVNLQKTDVIVDGPGVIVLMEHDGLDSKVHLIRIIFIEVVVAHTDSQPAGGLPITAVTIGNNHVLGNERSTAHQRSTNTSTEEHNLVGELSWVSLSSSDNLSTTSGQRSGETLLGELGGSGGKIVGGTEAYP